MTSPHTHAYSPLPYRPPAPESPKLRLQEQFPDEEEASITSTERGREEIPLDQMTSEEFLQTAKEERDTIDGDKKCFIKLVGEPPEMKIEL